MTIQQTVLHQLIPHTESLCKKTDWRFQTDLCCLGTSDVGGPLDPGMHVWVRRVWVSFTREYHRWVNDCQSSVHIWPDLLIMYEKKTPVPKHFSVKEHWKNRMFTEWEETLGEIRWAFLANALFMCERQKHFFLLVEMFRLFLLLYSTMNTYVLVIFNWLY